MEIKKASELKVTDRRRKAMEYCTKWIMYYIEEANKKGLNKVCFSPTSTSIDGVFIDCEEELRRNFSEAGYYFKPTGYVGGVRQRTTDICWR